MPVVQDAIGDYVCTTHNCSAYECECAWTPRPMTKEQILREMENDWKDRAIWNSGMDRKAAIAALNVAHVFSSDPLYIIPLIH
jgi:hypothetical protein